LNQFLRNDKNIPSGILVRADLLERLGWYDENFTGMYEDLVMHAKICLSRPVFVSSKSWYRYRQHPDSCNAKAWLSGRDRETRLAFLRWLEGYLIQTGATQGTVWETLQAQLVPFHSSLTRRLPGILRRRSSSARRFVREITRKTQFRLPVILCYHRIFEPKTDPHLLSVSPENFRQHLDVIRRLGQPMCLDELVDAGPREDFPRRGVLITFDDGYRDNFENAFPLLREAGLPATIYITTGNLGLDREFWWDDLERLTLGAAELPKLLRLRINGRIREWEMKDALARDREWNVLASGRRNDRQRLFCDLHAALRPLTQPLQDDVLEQLRRMSGTPAEARPFYRCMNVPELETLAAEPLITLGAHTISHCDLDFRTRTEQWAEASGSKHQLEKIIGRLVEHFSYPYGSFNDDSLAVCAQNEFRSAVTCIEEPVRRKFHRYRLPRFLVRNWDGAQFERRLKRFFRG
jgi:peptidoglycan/xylan/chitin deacetylase (PgdA/CDA1 family)